MVDPRRSGGGPDAGRLDLSRPRLIHIVGVGGAAMSAIASVLSSMGHGVTGSDLKASPGLERLRAMGVTVSVGHQAGQVGEAEALAVSTAVPASNPEVVRARELGLPVLSRAEILSAIAATRRTVAVAGTHGKTTTSSMLALVAVEGGLRPSFVIGGDLNEIGTGAAWDEGEWLVAEADESDGTFLELRPEVAVVTSIEPDHLEHYGSYEALTGAFGRFLSAVPGARIVSADFPVAAGLAAGCGAVTYGTSPGADYRITRVRSARSRVSFSLEHAGEDLGPIEVPVPGLHNARNAAAAVVAGLALGVDLDAARRALARFAGVARRFQFRGERDGVTYVDDYAHLPGEVAPVLAAAAAGGWGRVVCVFQPHRYSRTAALWASFADAFAGADLLAVTDVYPAGEEPRPGVSGQLVADAVAGAHPDQAVVYLPDRVQLREWLERSLRPGDLCLTLGAGDLTSLAGQLLDTEGGG
ncbi:MAG: UDP-N-acetylmuramate--L-alanine ligase [Acidimicrobiales bacterium]